MNTNPNLSTKSRSLPVLIAVTAFAMLAITAQVSAQHFVTINAPGAGTGAYQGTLPWGINLLGTVDGTYIDANSMYHGFLRTPYGKIVTFDVPSAGTGAGQGTVPQGINVWGSITGQSYEGNVSHGFLRAPNGGITTFDVPGAGAAGILGSGGVGSWASEYQGTYPESINDLGEIAGYYVDRNWVWHGFVRDPNGKITPFDAPGAGTGPYQGTGVNYTCPSLNNAGVLAGYYIDGDNLNHGYLRTRDGHITTFDDPSAGDLAGMGTTPSSINLEGTISGIATDAVNWHGFVRTPGDKFTTYSALNDPAEMTTAGEDINDFGVVTGYVNDAVGLWHGFVRTPDGKLTMFEAPEAATGTWQGTFAESINLEGMIVGFYFDSSNGYHGYVRTPY